MFDPITAEALGRCIQDERRAEAERDFRFSSFKPEQRGFSFGPRILLDLFALCRTSFRPEALTPSYKLRIAVKTGGVHRG
jgi:hypothetical protein